MMAAPKLQGIRTLARVSRESRADPRRVYCSENCRKSASRSATASEIRRAAARAQWIYWNSISEPADVEDAGESR